MLVLDNVEHRDLVIQEKSKLAAFFHSIVAWSDCERCVDRRVQLSIRGMPPQVWNRDNMVKVASLFGEVLEVDGWSVDGVAMEEGRVRVLSREMGFISEEILAMVGDIGVSLFVCECYHLGHDSWTVQHSHVDRKVRSDGELDGDHGHSLVPESSDIGIGRDEEGIQGSMVGSSQKTKSARVAYDLVNEVQLLNSQGVDIVASDDQQGGPPGFEECLNVNKGVTVGNLNGSLEENARQVKGALDHIIAPNSMHSTDSNVAEQAVALVKLLEGQVDDEAIAKEVIVSQRRSQRLAQKNH